MKAKENMGQRAFDILPPFIPVKTPSVPAPKKQRSNAGCLLAVVVIIFIFAFFAQASKRPLTMQNTNVNSTTNNTSENNLDLFNNNSNNNFSLPQNSTIKIRILNASGSFDSLDSVKKLLTSNAFSIEQTTNSSDIYEQTIIYYKNNQINKANIVKSAISSKYNVKTQLSETLGSSYDVLVIIGKQ